jgi:hypothetical protein
MTNLDPKRLVARARRTRAAVRPGRMPLSRLAAMRAPTLVFLIVLLVPVLVISLRGSLHPTEMGLTMLIAAFGLRGLWRTYRNQSRRAEFRSGAAHSNVRKPH